MDQINANATSDASVIRGGGIVESDSIHGRYEIQCVGADGSLRWTDHIDNVVTTVGKNFILDKALAGSSYTVTGPFIGLISSVGYGAGPLATDTMASHSGWNEAGNGSNYPVWTTPTSNARATASWAAASSGAKSLSASASFTIGATGGTIKGCFMVFGTGAVSTNADTNGTLLSAGTFSSDKVVVTSDVLNVSYTLSL